MTPATLSAAPTSLASHLGSDLAGPRLPAGRGEGADANGFASILSRSNAEAANPEQRAREGAEQFVAISLVQPIFKQLRETTMAQGPFKPNTAERTFRTMYDSELARRMVKSANWPLVDRIATGLMKTQAAAPTAAPDNSSDSKHSQKDLA